MLDRFERQEILLDNSLSPETKLYRLMRGDEDNIKEHNPELWYAMLEWKDKNIDKISFDYERFSGYMGYKNGF